MSELMTADVARIDLAPDTAARLGRIRDRLPGQRLRERIDTARLGYGELYTLAAVREKAAGTLPRRLGFTRSTALDPIETYDERIPDEALLKYDDAVKSGLFARFFVVTPTYYRDRQTDPWIVGQVADTELYAVIAQWEE